MNAIILNAYKKANQKLDELLKPADTTELRERFEKMNKKELVELLVQLHKPQSGKITTETLVYSILTEPDCAWLSFDVIAELIKKKLPDAKTSKSCLSWYQTHAKQKGYDIVLRKSQKEINALLMESLG